MDDRGHLNSPWFGPTALKIRLEKIDYLGVEQND